MAYCSSYYLYQRYEKRGNQNWLPSYPNVYSIDGEGSQPLRARQMYDTDCGWIPDTEVQYRTVSGTPYCSGETGYDKYVYETYQVSYDGGITWSTTGTADVLVERNSPDCGYIPPTPIYRWAQITPISGDSSTYVCDDCPLTNIKLSANYSDSTTYTVECNSSTTLSRTEVTGHSTPYSSMISAEIGNCVTSIGNEAFQVCRSLTSINIPDSVTSIGYYAFYNCSSLTSIVIPSGVTSIDSDAFRNCTSLTSCTIGSGLTSIGNFTFFQCSGLTRLNSNVDGVFNIPSGVTSIGYYAFYNCSSLTSIVIPSGVTSIGDAAFYNCSGLTSINIPDSVTSIDSDAFRNCTSLTSCTIGSGLTSIGGGVFYSCSGLTSITVNATTPPTLGEFAFDSTSNYPIYVPASSVNAYKSATNWSNYADRIQAKYA